MSQLNVDRKFGSTEKTNFYDFTIDDIKIKNYPRKEISEKIPKCVLILAIRMLILTASVLKNSCLNRLHFVRSGYVSLWSDGLRLAGRYGYHRTNTSGQFTFSNANKSGVAFFIGFNENEVSTSATDNDFHGAPIRCLSI